MTTAGYISIAVLLNIFNIKNLQSGLYRMEFHSDADDW